MKFLVLAACVAVAAGSQGFYGLQSYPNGAVTPLDEPAVAAARADHLAAKFGAGGAYAAGPALAAIPAPVVSSVGPAVAAVPESILIGEAVALPYSGPLHVPTLVAHPNGAVTPADEPAVAAARAEHLSAYAAYPQEVIVEAAPAVAPAPLATAPIIAAEVIAAPAPYAGPLHIPTLVAHPNGAVTPADEPAVAAARAEHLSAYGAYAADYAYGGYAQEVIAAPAPYTGPLHVPTLVAHPNGAVTPADEPAVAAARAEHLSAYGYAAAYPYGGLVSYPNGAVVPADEPAVAARRAEHLAALGGSHY